MSRYKILVDGKDWEEADSYKEACEMAEYKSQWHDDVDIVRIKEDNYD